MYQESKKTYIPIYILKTASRGNKNMAELLATKGANSNIKNSDGKSALDFARIRGNGEIYEILRQRTACQNTECAALETNWCDFHKYPPICMRCDGKNKITFGYCRKNWKIITTTTSKPLPEFDIKYGMFTEY